MITNGQMTIEQARATLILFHNIDEPTKEQIAMFIVYGEVVK